MSSAVDRDPAVEPILQATVQAILNVTKRDTLETREQLVAMLDALTKRQALGMISYILAKKNAA